MCEIWKKNEKIIVNTVYYITIIVMKSYNSLKSSSGFSL